MTKSWQYHESNQSARYEYQQSRRSGSEHQELDSLTWRAHSAGKEQRQCTLAFAHAKDRPYIRVN
jgi:hypothetical protein